MGKWTCTITAIVCVVALLAIVLASGCGGGASPGDGGDDDGPDDPGPGPVSCTLSVSDAQVMEGDSGLATLQFTVSLSEINAEDTSFDWSTAAETADQSDFQNDSGSETIWAGDLETTIDIYVYSDTALEPDEILILTISNPSGATIAAGEAVGTIQNDDGALRLVDLTGDNTTGLTWKTAYRSVQAAVSAVSAAGGGEVWVAAGAYTGSPGSTLPVLAMEEQVHLYGGFEGYRSGSGACESGRNQRDPETNTVVLDGDNGTANATQVVVGASNATLDAFQVINGAGGSGAGMYNLNCSSLAVRNCTFSANQAAGTNDGGGMYNENTSATLTGCTFADNSAEFGGGLYIKDCQSFTVESCTFSLNSGSGGGIAVESSSTDISGCEFTENSAQGSSSGGGMLLQGTSSATVSNCTFENNDTDFRGGGAAITGDVSADFIECSFKYNTAHSGGGLDNRFGSSASFYNCFFFENTSDTSGGAIHNYEGSLSVDYCRFLDNIAVGDGGAIRHWSDNSLVMGECRFTSNTAGISGGAVYSYPSLLAEFCAFQGNSTGEEDGGALYLTGGDSVEYCIFLNNQAVRYGGALSTRGSSEVEYCVMMNNSAEHGGAMYSFGSSTQVVNCTITGNSAVTSGGALFNTDSSTPELVNCIIYANAAGSSDPEMYNSPSSQPVVSYCNIRGCGGSGAGWDAAFGSDHGGNIDSAPQFVNEDIYFPTQLFSLQIALDDFSPCRDAADGSAANTAGVQHDIEDIDGNSPWDDMNVDDTGTGSITWVDLGALEAWGHSQ